MTSGQTKITVVIPTRERADTLYHCLKSVVSQPYERFEVVVSDNHSRDATEEVVKSFSSPRVRYVNTGARLSMAHNWEFGLRQVRAGWVTILGDDDALLPGALARVDEVIRETDCAAVVSPRCHYYWPNSTSSENRLTIPMSRGWELRNAREWLSRLMRGEASYPELPCFYTGGFVDTRTIDRARSEEGQFFRSMVPDVYSAVALASTIDRYVAMKEPLAVAGISAHSNGASYLRLGAHRAPAEQVLSEDNIPFHSMLGSNNVRSIPILVFESYLQAEPLHGDFLGVDLADQLGLALARATVEEYGELRKYCEDVAVRMGVPMSVVDERVNSSKRGALRRVMKGLSRSWQEMTVNAKDFHVADVHGAALLAAQLYQSEREQSHWRRRNVAQFLGMLVNRRVRAARPR